MESCKKRNKESAAMIKNMSQSKVKERKLYDAKIIFHFLLINQVGQLHNYQLRK